MCELFAMNSQLPCNVNFSLGEFAKHGGATDHHEHGWGVAYFEHNDVRLIREVDPAAESDHLEFLQSHNYDSKMVLSHIRYATQGELSLANTQPFSHEFNGKKIVFAHNGNLKDFSPKVDGFTPIGETDSERAFCHIMSCLRREGLETLKDGFQRLHEIFLDLQCYGPFNCLIGDGNVLIAHGHQRTQKNKKIGPPGLHYLCRQCLQEDRSMLPIKGLDISNLLKQEVVLVGSVPLSKEKWRAFEEGETMLIKDGCRIKSLKP